MAYFIDQMQHTIRLDHLPERIISLVPSQTELLIDLGLEERLIAVTKFCIHPSTLRRKKIIIGGTKQLHIQKILDLQPDLIIGNKEENEAQQILELQRKATVWMSEIYTLQDAFNMIAKIGELTETVEKAEQLVVDIQQKFNALVTVPKQNKKTLYLIWRDPYMVAGKNTFIDHLLELCGWENVVRENRYPSLDTAMIQQLNPQLILLSSEPYSFKEKHIRELKKICPSAEIRLVDGEMFSWYGSRLRYAPAYFQQILKSSML